MIGKVMVLASQKHFRHAATRLGKTDMRIRAWAFMAALAFCVVASVWIGYQLHVENRLFKSGAPASAMITDVAIKEGRNKRGELRYGVTVSYAFTTANGTNYTGKATRRLLKRPGWAAGQSIHVLFDAANPNCSTLRFGLEAEIADKRVALPMFALIALMSSLFLWRWWRG